MFDRCDQTTLLRILKPSLLTDPLIPSNHVWTWIVFRYFLLQFNILCNEFVFQSIIFVFVLYCICIMYISPVYCAWRTPCSIFRFYCCGRNLRHLWRCTHCAYWQYFEFKCVKFDNVVWYGNIVLFQAFTAWPYCPPPLHHPWTYLHILRIR